MLEKALVSAANLKRFTENLCNESYPLSDGRAEEVDELERRWPWKATTRSCRRQIGCILQLAKFIGELGRLPFWAHTFICLERYRAELLYYARERATNRRTRSEKLATDDEHVA